MEQDTRTGRVLSVETPESVAFAYELAGLGSRGIAIVIDSALVLLLVLAEGVVLALALWLTGVAQAGGLGFAAGWGVWVLSGFIVAVFVTVWGYFILGETMGNGRTPGKRALGIRVARDDGGRVRPLDSVIRNALRIVDLLPGSYAVGVVSIVFSEQNKRLGDHAAGTVVVRDTGGDDLDFEIGEGSERDTLTAEYLGRRGEMSEAARWQVATAILASYGESPAPGWDEPTVAGRLADLAGLRADTVAAEPTAGASGAVDGPAGEPLP